MTKRKGKAILDEVTYYELLRNHESDVLSTVRIVKTFYDTKESQFLRDHVRLRLRSIESAGHPRQFDLSVKVGPTCLSCIISNSDAQRITEKPDCLKGILPLSMRTRFSDHFEGFDDQGIVCLGEVCVERTYIAIEDLLVGVDSCFHSGNRFWEAHLYHNDPDAAKQVFLAEMQRLKCVVEFESEPLLHRVSAPTE